MYWNRLVAATVVLGMLVMPALSRADVDPGQLYAPHGHAAAKPVDSNVTVAVGDEAPEFALPALNGTVVRLSQFRGISNVVLSFVPAAFTPVCSGQWPGYNIARELFEQHNAVLLGITTDNLPSLHAWTHQMDPRGMWFPVLSDFWPHGAAASLFGILRPEGVAERAIFIIDRQGIIRHIEITDINLRPDLGGIIRKLSELQ